MAIESTTKVDITEPVEAVLANVWRINRVSFFLPENDAPVVELGISVGEKDTDGTITWHTDVVERVEGQDAVDLMATQQTLYDDVSAALYDFVIQLGLAKVPGDGQLV